MQKVKKNNKKDFDLFLKQADNIHPSVEINPAGKRERNSFYHEGIGGKLYVKQPFQLQSEKKKDLIGRIRRSRAPYEKIKRKIVFEPSPKVHIYNDKEIEAIIIEVGKVTLNINDKEKKDNLKRKFMNLILGITESDLIEVARNA